MSLFSFPFRDEKIKLRIRNILLYNDRMLLKIMTSVFANCMCVFLNFIGGIISIYISNNTYYNVVFDISTHHEIINQVNSHIDYSNIYHFWS